jgi:glycosyltransferase involved in cell wall biosynthesis
MRVIVVDPGLGGNRGHHLSFNQALSAEFRARGTPSLHLVSAMCDPQVLGGLAAVSLFSLHPHAHPSADPVAGDLESFLKQSEALEAELSRLPAAAATPDDVMVVAVETPALLLALLRWWSSRAPEARPRVVVILTLVSGLVSIEPMVLWDNPYWAFYARFYRFVGRQMAGMGAPFAFLAPRDMADDFAFLIQTAIGEMPINSSVDPAFVDPLAEAFERSAQPPTVGYFGDSRVDKGFARFSGLVEESLARDPDLRFVIQIFPSGGDPAILEAAERLTALAARESRIELLRGYCPPDIYYDAMARVDCVVLPYSDLMYGRSPSGVFVESMSIGRPAVVRAGTWMARRIAELGGHGETFDSYATDDVVAALFRAVARTAEFRASAPKLRTTWRRMHGIGPLVDKILEARPA